MKIFQIKLFSSDFLARLRSNKRGYFSLIFLLAIFVLSLFAEVIANDKPLLAGFGGKIYFPFLQQISEEEFGGQLLSEADYSDPEIQKLIKKNGWIIFAPIRFSFDTINLDLNDPAPSSPSLVNILGTDDQGRDVFARLLYGIRLSLAFGFILSAFSLVIGVVLGAMQGYFGGLIDIILQRFIEIWSSLPMMFLLMIFAAVITPSFVMLLFLMLLFSWISVIGYVRAEFLRLRNFDFVRASRALGASDWRIMFRHILPNAAAIIIANLPFLIASSITTLTALDFLGLGLPVGSPSLGEILAQGKNNLSSPWLAIAGFLTITSILTALVFVGEALRDAFDSKKIG